MKQDTFDHCMSQLAIEEALRHTSEGLDTWMTRRRHTLYRRCALLSLIAILILTPILMACTPPSDGIAINRSSVLKKAEVCRILSQTLSCHEDI